MSEENLKRYGIIQNILQDDWKNILSCSSSNLEITGLEELLDNKKLHTVKTESIKRYTSHFFSESEQARILNLKTRIGKKLYYQAFIDRQNSITRELAELKYTRSALQAEKESLKSEITTLKSSVRSLEGEECTPAC